MIVPIRSHHYCLSRNQVVVVQLFDEDQVVQLFDEDQVVQLFDED
jgi:hypothetical protein